jgi:hypothetical protein
MAKKDKQAKTPKLPKRIGGVKVPKELRKAGGGAARLLDHPIVGELVTAALMAAAVALSENKEARHAVGEGASDAARKTARSASKAKLVLKAAAGAVGKGILDEIKSGGGVKRGSRTPRG